VTENCFAGGRSVQDVSVHTAQAFLVRDYLDRADWAVAVVPRARPPSAAGPSLC